MKLDNETCEFIIKLMKAANLVGVPDLIVEPGRIAGTDAGRTVAIFQEDNMPNLDFAIGLNRSDVFLSRLDVVRHQEGFAIEANEDDKGEEIPFIRQLILKAKGTKLDYRCANPATIKAPRTIHDTLDIEVTLTSPDVTLMQKGFTAMSSASKGADMLAMLVGGSNGVLFSLTDDNSDTFTHAFSEGTTDTFSHKYPVKTLLALFKYDPEGKFRVGKKGILQFNVDGITVYVLPKV